MRYELNHQTPRFEVPYAFPFLIRRIREAAQGCARLNGVISYVLLLGDFGAYVGRCRLRTERLGEKTVNYGGEPSISRLSVLLSYWRRGRCAFHFYKINHSKS